MSNRISKEESEKEFICKQCSLFLDHHDLKNGCCPECGSDEEIYLNIQED